MKCPHCQTELRLVKVAGSGETQPNNGDGQLKELLAAAQDQPMTDWESTFYADLKARYAQYGARTKVSEKQMTILRKIASGEGGRERNDEF